MTGLKVGIKPDGTTDACPKLAEGGPNMPLFLKRGWGDLAPQKAQRIQRKP
jgi:hypothetical protein